MAHIASAQYAGPALLTRGEAPGMATMPTIRFRPFADLSAVYDTGLTGVSLNTSGELRSRASIGVRLAFGISGTHQWRHTNLGVDYRGSISHYVDQSYYDGMSHSLMIGLTHQFSRHISMSFSENAGMYSHDFGLLGMPQTSLFDPSTASIPTTDYFDNRTIYYSTSARLIMQRSARLSFAFGGNQLGTLRRSKALQDVTGVNATGDVQYRISRRSTVGGNYGYTHYFYSSAFGSTDIHSLSATYATAPSPHVEFSGFAGVMRPDPSNWQTLLDDRLIFEVQRGSAGGELEWLINGKEFDPTTELVSLTNRAGHQFAATPRKELLQPVGDPQRRRLARCTPSTCTWKSTGP